MIGHKKNESVHVEHGIVCYEKGQKYLVGPAEAGGMFNFGQGEIACMFFSSSSDYTSEGSVKHGQFGQHGRSQVIMARSYDHGRTWHKKDMSTVYDHNRPLSLKQQELKVRPLDEYMSLQQENENRIFWAGKPYCGKNLPAGGYAIKPFVTQSDDNGHTWKKPYILFEELHFTLLAPAAASYIYTNNRILLFPCVVGTTPGMTNNASADPKANYSVVLYGTDNSALPLQYISTVANDPSCQISYSYPNIVDVGNGHLICTLGAFFHRYAQTRWISICHSYDGGLNWSKPKTVIPWAEAPYLLVLSDGRLMIVFSKRNTYACLQHQTGHHELFRRGLQAVVSEDQGKTWNHPFTIRNDASSFDIGYPVATRVDDNSVLVVYYYTVDDGVPFGGTRYIAYSHLKI